MFHTKANSMPLGALGWYFKDVEMEICQGNRMILSIPLAIWVASQTSVV
jgi:hypothetical protein